HGGAVWRDDQSEVLLMNTTTCQTTMYPDESCHALLPVPRSETLAEHLAGEGLRPTDFAPRAAHGRYLAHVLETAKAAAAPERLRIVEHAAEAVDVTGPADGAQRVRLSDGRVLRADEIGIPPQAPCGRLEPASAAASGLRYRPGGGEPRLLVASRPGLVGRAKPALGARLPAPWVPQELTG